MKPGPASLIWQQLERLGVHRGWPPEPSPRPGRGPAIEDLVPGRLVETRHGRFFLARQHYPPDYMHGRVPLRALLDHASSPLLAGQTLDWRRAVFLDTETTGLARGAYTFLVGVGFFTQDDRGTPDSFCLEQYLMRDPGEELPMLTALSERLAGQEALVSFNGRAFDLPLLKTRFTCKGLTLPLENAPHLDLLGPTRRLWRTRLSSCALSVVETHVLGVRRTCEDVPGHAIPTLYFQYLQTGNAQALSSVFYHNQMDVLSLASLSAVLWAAQTDVAGLTPDRGLVQSDSPL